MNSARLKDVVAAVMMAYEPERPCELCSFALKCGDMAELEGFCASGVALCIRGAAAKVAAARPVEQAVTERPAPSASTPKQEQLSFAQPSGPELRPQTVQKYAEAADALARVIRRRSGDFFALIDQLELLVASGKSKTKTKTSASCGHAIDSWLHVRGLSTFHATPLRAYIYAVRPDLNGRLCRAHIDFEHSALRAVLDEELVVRLKRELEQRREAVLGR